MVHTASQCHKASDICLSIVRSLASRKGDETAICHMRFTHCKTCLGSMCTLYHMMLVRKPCVHAIWQARKPPCQLEQANTHPHPGAPTGKCDHVCTRACMHATWLTGSVRACTHAHMHACRQAGMHACAYWHARAHAHARVSAGIDVSASPRLRVSASPRLCVPRLCGSMPPRLHVSMSPCLCVSVSLSLCLYVSIIVSLSLSVPLPVRIFVFV